MAKAPDNFAQIFPDHPHRRMHILVSILAFVLVVGSIVAYQIKISQDKTDTAVVQPPRDLTEITEAYRAQKIADLEALASSTPPVTDAQRKKALDNLNKLTAEDQKNKQ